MHESVLCQNYLSIYRIAFTVFEIIYLRYKRHPYDSRILLIKIPRNKTADTVDTWAWIAVVCVKNNALAWCFSRSFYEGYGNIKIRIPVTDKLFLDLVLHWTLNYTYVLQIRRDRLDYERRIIMGFGTSLITTRGRATHALLSLYASIVRRVSCTLWYTHVLMMCSPDKAWNIFLRGKYGSPEESFSPRQ